ncbi:MAG TPA: NAD(+) synthase [Planctomycetota bacterium]|nr:NAD(+) synthase [Planctomycetota bacterium]
MFSKDVLRLDTEAEVNRLCKFLQDRVLAHYKRKGVVVGISGGIDSAVVTALNVRAFGAERVLGVVLPEKESNPISAPLARRLAGKFGVPIVETDLTPILAALGVYRHKDLIIGRLAPGYAPEADKTKISLPANVLDRAAYNVFTLTVQKPNGTSHSVRLGADDFREIESVQNMKQRVRMVQLYHHAERLHRVVCGTTNKTEADQGFYVKYGDGGVDIEPIAHLYKTQVYDLGRCLGVTDEILNRMPSPDTWSGGVGDEEFYFRMPFEMLDLLLYAWNNAIPKTDIRGVLNLTEEQIDRAFGDFEAKSRATWHLRTMPDTIAEASLADLQV